MTFVTDGKKTLAPATVMSVSFSGELAYEIHVENQHLAAAYRALRTAGEVPGMTLFGARAVESMRLEKGYLHWKSELLTEFDPFETGLDRFVKMDKDDFIGKDALADRLAIGPHRKLVTLEVKAEDRPAHGGASVMLDGTVVGTVTTGAMGYRTGQNLAMAFVLPDLAAAGADLHLDLLGDLIPAKVIPAGPFDPNNSRVRA